MGLIAEIRKLNYQDLKIFLIPTIIFLFYLSVFYPCIAAYDSFNQLHQIASGHFGNWHPFFHTFINMLCLKIYPNPASICIFQILVFSTMWLVICKYNRNDNLENNKTFKYQIITTVIICLIPINAIYSITLWKDILFSYCLMFLCFLAKVMIDKNGKVDYKFIIVISLIMAFVSQLRGNGFYVIIAVLIVYSIYLFVKKNIKMGILLPVLTVIFILLIASLNIVYHVQDNEKDALIAKTSHMLADYVLNLEIDEADKNTIYQLIDENKTSKVYRSTETDSIWIMLNRENAESNKSTYIKLALKYSLKNPLYCLHYLFKSAPMVWDITKDSDWVGRPYYISFKSDEMQSVCNRYYIKHNFTPTTPYENLSYANWGTPVFKVFNSLAIGIENSLFDTFFNSPALYMYLSIILMVAIHFITKSRAIYLMYLPNLLNIVIVFLSTPIQDYRYLYPNLLACYLLVIIFIQLYFSGGKSKILSLKNRF